MGSKAKKLFSVKSKNLQKLQMIDSVTLKIQPPIIPKEIIKRIETFSGYQINGRLKNLFLVTKDEYSVLRGSLPKFIHGSNLEPLRYNEIASTTKELENVLQRDVANSPILSIEWGATVKTAFPPKTYYPILGETWPFERVQFKNSLYFNSPKKKFIYYDKGKEARCSGNLLRSELRLPKTKPLELTLGKLSKPEDFNRLTKIWLDFYQSLNKIRKPVPLQLKTKTDLNRFYKSIGIEVLGGKDKALQMIDNLHRQGKINDCNKSRMKDDLKKFIANVSQATELEHELNEKFLLVANQNTIPTCQ